MRAAAGATLLAILAVLLTATPGFGAKPSTETLYLTSSGVPTASLSTVTPPDIPLPNFDPARDKEPGLVLARSAKGASESDPTRYQQWSHDAGGSTLSISKLVIWARTQDSAPDKSGKLAGYLMDCGGSCTVLDTATAVVPPGSTWAKLTLSFNLGGADFDWDRRLVVKLTALSSSSDDLLLAYATRTFDAYLQVTVDAVAATTTTTTTTTTPTTTTPGSKTTTTSTTTTTTTAPVSSGPPTTRVTPTKPTTGPHGGAAAVVPTTTQPTPPRDPAGDGRPVKGKTAPVAGPAPASATQRPAVAQGREIKPTEVTNTAIAMGAEDISGEDVSSHAELTPEDGLTLMFSIVTENIRIYWRAAVALGALGAVMAVIGFSRVEPNPTDRLRASARLRSLGLGGHRSDRPVPLDRP